jgi:hypothetical protein
VIRQRAQRRSPRFDLRHAGRRIGKRHDDWDVPAAVQIESLVEPAEVARRRAKIGPPQDQPDEDRQIRTAQPGAIERRGEHSLLVQRLVGAEAPQWRWGGCGRHRRGEPRAEQTRTQLLHAQSSARPTRRSDRNRHRPGCH